MCKIDGVMDRAAERCNGRLNHTNMGVLWLTTTWSSSSSRHMSIDWRCGCELYRGQERVELRSRFWYKRSRWVEGGRMQWNIWMEL